MTSSLDITSKIHFTDDNVILMEVDNLLVGWPTYELNFTPKKPGPLVSKLGSVYLVFAYIYPAETYYPSQRCFKTCPP
jgi:hypothetical protein